MPPLPPSRPTIVVDGTERQYLSRTLTSLLIVEHTSGLYRCEASFDNWAPPIGEGSSYPYLGRNVLDFGTSLVIKLGDESVFQGRISAITGRYWEQGMPEVIVRAEDRLFDFRMTRRTRSFHDGSFHDVLVRMVGDHGLTLSANLTTAANTRVLAQVNESDLSYLREQCRRIGVEVWVEDNHLRVGERGDRGGESTELRLGADLHKVEVSADLAEQFTHLTLSGWDVAAKQPADFTATHADIASELEGNDGGADVLQRAFGDRRNVVANSSPANAGEAEALAKARFIAAARRFVTARGVATTSSSLRVGRAVKLADLGGMFDGNYYLTEVRHRFDAEHGLRTEFTADRPWLGEPS